MSLNCISVKGTFLHLSIHPFYRSGLQWQQVGSPLFRCVRQGDRVSLQVSPAALRSKLILDACSRESVPKDHDHSWGLECWMLGKLRAPSSPQQSNTTFTLRLTQHQSTCLYQPPSYPHSWTEEEGRRTQMQTMHIVMQCFYMKTRQMSWKYFSSILVV